jgi:uncharacterized damage-inducible protein DinB
MNNHQTLIEAALETLRQGETLLQELSDESYTRRLPAAFNASVGGHYRHCLDHFRGLLESHASGELDYDQRERNTLIEHDRFAALNATRALCEGMERLAQDSLDRELAVTCKTSYCAAGSQVAVSTTGREIMYAVAHAVHHYALISIMGGLMGIKLPAGFGVAPSTLKHQAALTATDA